MVMQINAISAADLMAMETKPLPQIVSSLITVGYTVLAGDPKAGKSWIALGLSLAVARGNKAFGQFATAQGNVLYIALEDNHHRLKNRLTKLSDNAAMPRNLFFATELPRLAEGGLEYLHNYIHTNEIKLTIIDTLGRVAEEKKGDLYQEDYALGAALQAEAFQSNSSIMVVHHANKVKGEKGVRKVSGTAGVTAAADGVLVLTRELATTIPKAKLYVTGRDIDEKNLDLEWSHGGWVTPFAKYEKARGWLDKD
jgi:RecA-family ATPase